MTGNALGFIETIGLTAAIEAADSAVKSANVRLLGYELAGGDGMAAVKIEGDVGAVKAAVKAAEAAAAKIGRVVSTHVIPRPAEGTERITRSRETIGLGKAEKAAAHNAPRPAKNPPEPAPEIPLESAQPPAEPKDVKKPRGQSKKARADGAVEPQSNGNHETPPFELKN
jgi:microcompartment protein CcmL/EutN